MKRLSLIVLGVVFGLALMAPMVWAADTVEVKPEPVLYERLGGEAAISKVVDDFVARTSVNPAVNFTRKGTPREWQATPENVAVLKKHLIDFIGTATGGPQNYQGRGMKEAHEGMQITDAEFDALAGDLQASLEALGVSDREKSELMTIAGTTRGAIVEKRSVSEADKGVPAADDDL